MRFTDLPRVAAVGTTHVRGVSGRRPNLYKTILADAFTVQQAITADKAQAIGHRAFHARSRSSGSVRLDQCAAVSYGDHVGPHAPPWTVRGRLRGRACALFNGDLAI